MPSLNDTEVPEYGYHQPGKSQAGQPDVQPDGHPVAGCSCLEERLLSGFVRRCSSEGRLPVERSGTARRCSARETGVASNNVPQYTVSQKKCYLAKCDYMGPFKPVCDIPYYLLQLCSIPGHV